MNLDPTGKGGAGFLRQPGRGTPTRGAGFATGRATPRASSRRSGEAYYLSRPRGLPKVD
jgi:hypothetical protein